MKAFVGPGVRVAVQVGVVKKSDVLDCVGSPFTVTVRAGLNVSVIAAVGAAGVRSIGMVVVVLRGTVGEAAITNVGGGEATSCEAGGVSDVSIGSVAVVGTARAPCVTAWPAVEGAGVTDGTGVFSWLLRVAKRPGRSVAGTYWSRNTSMTRDNDSGGCCAGRRSAL